MTPPERRGNFANTVVWTIALLAIAGLTVWKFDIWPVDWVTTETGKLAGSHASADDFTAAPIQVAGPGREAPAEVDATVSANQPAPPSTELTSLDLTHELPEVSNRQAPTRPAEPDLVSGEGLSRPSAGPPAALPTGSDFAETGLFPEATAPVAGSAVPDTPPPSEEPAPLPDAAGAGSPVPSDVMPVSAEVTADAAATTDAANFEPVDPRLAAIDADIAADRYLAAHKALSKMYWDDPQSRPAIQSRIDTTARSIYFDSQPHYMPPYEIQPGDQLRLVAGEYAVPWEYLARLNGIDDPARVRFGQRIKVLKGPFSAIVDLSDYSLTVHAHGYYVRRYAIGIGKDGTTPVGTFHVVTKESNPKYWGSDGNVLERDDPANPLGERWLGLDDGAGSATSYGIHGTIDPASIGKSESAGCVRLTNEHVAEIYDMLDIGSKVVIQR